MTLDRTYLQDIVDGVLERMQFTREAVREGTEGLALGASGVDDETFRAFFEIKTARNPNWPLALAFVKGGNALIARYERITGLAESDA